MGKANKTGITIAKKVIEAGFFYKNDVPGGVGLVFRNSDFPKIPNLCETFFGQKEMNKMIAFYDSQITKEYSRQDICTAMMQDVIAFGQDPQKTMGDMVKPVHIANCITYLVHCGVIKQDEFNGNVFMSEYK